MRTLTFLGFLKNYLKMLAGENTSSLTRLAELAETNYRLREPLVLFAIISCRTEYLKKVASGTEFMTECGDVLSKYDVGTITKAMAEKDEALPMEYHKVMTSYLRLVNKTDVDNRTKSVIRNKVIKLQSKSGLSNYRIYKDLGLNGGNINAWLRNGDCDKISLAKAYAVLDYTQNYNTFR